MSTSEPYRTKSTFGWILHLQGICRSPAATAGYTGFRRLHTSADENFNSSMINNHPMHTQSFTALAIYVRLL